MKAEISSRIPPPVPRVASGGTDEEAASRDMQRSGNNISTDLNGEYENHRPHPLDRKSTRIENLFSHITLQESDSRTCVCVGEVILVLIGIATAVATFTMTEGPSQSGVTAQNPPPTSLPTELPSAMPTGVPTFSPTFSPSFTPTVTPTKRPTRFPTTAPSGTVPSPPTTLSPTVTCNIAGIIPVVFGIGTSITVVGKGLKCLPSRYFEPIVFKDVTSIRIESNNIPTVQTEAFVGLGALDSLTFRDNYIATIEADAMKSLTNLRSLSMSSNQLNGYVKYIHTSAFQDLVKLEYLRVDTLDLTNLDAALFTAMSGLTRIRMRSGWGGFTIPNRAGLRVPENSFSAMTKLTSLDVAGLNIGPTLGEEDLPMLSNETLTVLNLEACGIKLVIPDVLSKFTALTELELDANEITSVPNNLPLTLERFYAKENKLSSLGALTTLTNLQHLFLRTNQITTIEPELSQLTKLEFIVLQANKISGEIPPSTFGTLGKLSSLDLSSNTRLEFVNESFDGVPLLGYLRLDNSGITELPINLLQRLSRLTTLLLQNNPMTALPNGIFDGATNLRDLDLSRNSGSLSFPPGVFSKLTKLTTLRAYGAISFLDFPCAQVFLNHTGLHDASVLIPKIPDC